VTTSSRSTAFDSTIAASPGSDRAARVASRRDRHRRPRPDHRPLPLASDPGGSVKRCTVSTRQWSPAPMLARSPAGATRVRASRR
jgi:hypothetical protein